MQHLLSHGIQGNDGLRNSWHQITGLNLVMMNLHRFLPFAFAFCSSFGKDMPKSLSNSIPVHQLGAEVQKHCPDGGTTITAIPGGARLKALMQDLEGEVSDRGLSLISTTDADAGERHRLSLKAVALGRIQDGGNCQTTLHLSEYGQTTIDTGKVTLARPGLVEEYSASTDGVRQDFVVLERPPGEGGSLALDLQLKGAYAEKAAYGAKIVIETTGRELAYSRLHVTDAKGRELSAHMEVPAVDCLRLVVEDDGADYPVRIDPTFSDADWVSMGGVCGTSGEVEAIASDQAGNLYIGGNFDYVDSVQVSNIAKWNGSVWTSLGEGVGGTVYCIATQGADVFVGGTFTTAGGITVNKTAKWDGSSWSALGSGLNGTVQSLVIDGVNLYAGGYFTTAGGVSASRVAKWNGTAWSSLGSGVADNVFALAVLNGVLYVGGDFATAGGLAAKNIAAWNGASWSPLGLGTSNVVTSLVAMSGDLYAGGLFSTAGGISANRVAKWNGSTWSSLGTGMNDRVNALATSGSLLYACGEFITAGGISAKGVAKWDGFAWSNLGAGISGDYERAGALAVSGGHLFIGGQFTQAGTVAANYLARWDGTAWSAMGYGMGKSNGGGGFNPYVYAVLVHGNDVYVGGEFSSMGGAVANRIAKWNGSQWTGLGTGADADVKALATDGSYIYAGGDFTVIGGVTTNRIARWNGSVWSGLGSGMTGGSVDALTLWSGSLYAGGTFSAAGGSSASRVARWNGSSWQSLSTGVNSDVNCLVGDNTMLYVGGRFTIAGGLSSAKVAGWNGTSWSSVGYQVSGGDVMALAVLNGELYAGGDFTNFGGQSAYGIARWNGTSWGAVGTGVGGTYRTVRSLFVAGSSLFVGGSFTSAGGIPANYIAKWNGTVWSGLGSGVDRGAVYSLGVGSDFVMVGGSFKTAGGKVSIAIAKGDLSLAPEMTVRGNGSTISSGDASPSLMDHTDFGLAKVVSGMTTRTFFIHNLGDANLQLDGNPLVQVSGSHAADFTVTSQPAVQVAAEGGMTSFSISFTPGGEGVRNALVSISSNQVQSSPYTFSLRGEGAWPDIALLSSAGQLVPDDGHLVLGDVRTAGSGLTFSISILNESQVALSGINAEIQGAQSSDFTILSTVPTTLNAGESSEVSIRFLPSALGSRIANLRALSEDPDEDPYVITLEGMGVASDIDVSITEIPLANGFGWSFGNVMANGNNVTFPIKIKNVGTAALTSISATITGTGSSHYTVITSPSASVPVDGETTLEVRFHPSSTGLKNASLQISCDDPDENPYIIQLSGFGILPDIELSSGGNVFPNNSSGSFGSVNANAGSVSASLLITNTGSALLNGLATSLNGDDAAHFSIVTTPLSALPPLASSVVEVRFQPSSVGQKSVILRISSNDPDENPYEVTLTGIGLPAPAAPVLVSPGTKTIPGITLTTLTPTFSWKAVTGAIGYSLIVREQTGTLVHLETSIGVTASYNLPEAVLRPGGRYQWTMQTRNAAGPGTESAPFFFVISEEPNAVPQPVLIAPGSRDSTSTVINTLTPTFRWKPVTEALGLRITVRDTESDVVVHETGDVGLGTNYTMPASILQPDRTYRWTLRGSNALGEGRWALPFYFATAPAVTLPPAPALVYPGGTSVTGATVYDPGILGARPLEWKPVTGATSYKVMVWPSGAGLEIHSANVAAPATTYTLPAGLLAQNEIFRWTVSAVTTTAESLPSIARIFRTPAVYPAPLITSFRPAQAVASNSLQWVLLQGNDFRSGAKVLQTYGTKTDFPAAPSNVQFYPAGIRVKINTGMVAGNWTFKVRNPDGRISNGVTLPVTLPATETLPAPALSPPPGTYAQPVSVTITLANSSVADIRYTDDGTEPDLSSSIYDNAPILLGAKTPVTLKAISVNETHTSAKMVPGIYKFNLPELKFQTPNEQKTHFAGDNYWYKLVIPAGLASFDLQTVVPQGRVKLYLAKGRLPTAMSYDFKSVTEPASGGDEVQAIRSQRVTAGTYFVMVECTDTALVAIGLVSTKGTVTQQPTISPGKGAHAAPLQVSMSHQDPDATIYYTVDSTAPNPLTATSPDASNLGSGTLIYRGPFLLSADAVVSAMAQKPGFSMSKVVSNEYSMKQAYGFFDMLLTEDQMDIPLMVPTFSSEASLNVSWSDKDPVVEHSFAFTVPPDQISIPGSAVDHIEYPVAMLFLIDESGGVNLDVSLNASGTLASSGKYPVVVKALPSLDQEAAQYYVLGPKQTNRGVPLMPGTKYYGRIKIKGSKRAAKSSVTAKLRLTLHSASLANNTGPIQPGKRTWIVSHGRDNTDSSAKIFELGDALDGAIAGRPEIGEQVLRLNWGTMASPSGGLLHGGDLLSFDEAMFTEPVGRRTAEVMRKWAISPDKCSLIGHSWGTYVCYEFAKSTKSVVQRLIALDPAFTGTGGYVDSQISFRKYATRSWAFVSDYSLNWQPLPYGNSGYAGTAHESFFVGPSMGNPLQLHALPLELFTLLLSRAYSAQPTDPVANFFAIDKLDGVPLARFKENDWPSPLRPHEGTITVGHGPDSDHALDASAAMTLRYTNKAFQLQTLTSPSIEP